jgi:hypothetical protein
MKRCCRERDIPIHHSGVLNCRLYFQYRDYSESRFHAEKISPRTYLNLMDQYHPCYRADNYPDLNRLPTPREYRDALMVARRYGLSRLDHSHASLRLEYQ